MSSGDEVEEELARGCCRCLRLLWDAEETGLGCEVASAGTNSGLSSSWTVCRVVGASMVAEVLPATFRCRFEGGGVGGCTGKRPV